MSSYTGVFERKEMKYRLNTQQLATLMPTFDAHLAASDFDNTRVRSMYYDTPSNDLVARSIESPIYKEKLRLRIYGNTIASTIPAFVEIKKKYKGIVYKRRIALSLYGAASFLDGMPYEDAVRLFPLADDGINAHILENEAQSKQIANEIAFFMKRYAPLEPSILTICDRRALIDPNGTDLRITIDTELRAKNHPKDIGDPSSAFPLIPDGDAIMEIKSASPLPLWLVSALSGAKAYKQSFSKCGTSYVRMHSGAQDAPEARRYSSTNSYTRLHPDAVPGATSDAVPDEASRLTTGLCPGADYAQPPELRAACTA